MNEQADTVLAYWREHREQLRQSENQRAVLTNYVLVIVAALSGFIVQQQLKPSTLPLSILVMAIGIFVSITVAKYHERADYHLGQARTLTRALVDLGALPDGKAELDASRGAHYGKYRRLHRIRLHKLWTGLHLGIALYGATLAAIALFR